MSRKKAKSSLPQELNENYGSNYMMDGFWHDMDYGGGLRENPTTHTTPQPSSSGMSHLPDGVIVGDFDNFLEAPESVERETEGAMDLGEIEILAAESGVVDLSWLDGVQDPDRLPSGIDTTLQELQESWGNRTDGIHRIDMTDRVETVQQYTQVDADSLLSLVRSAMRRSAAGDLSYALQCKSSPKMAAAMAAVEAEHGLVGRVYVRASVFPKLHQGKYSKQFKQAAKSCLYLIGEDNEFNREAARLTQLKLLKSAAAINWQKAYQHYSPGLVATGRLRKASVLSPEKCRIALQKAFLREGSAPRLDIETTKIRYSMPVDRVSSEQAKKALAEFKPSHQEVLSWVERQKQAALEKVTNKIGAWVQARLLSSDEAKKLLQTKASPEAILRTASAMVTATKQGQYQGEGKSVFLHQLARESSVSAQDWERALQKKAAQELAKEREKLVNYAERLVAAKVITQEQANTLLATGVQSRLAMRAVSKLASQATQTSQYSQGSATHHKAAPASAEASPDAVRKHALQAKRAQEIQDQRFAEVRASASKKQQKTERLQLKVAKIESLVDREVSLTKLKAAVRELFTVEEIQQVRAQLDPILVRGGFFEKKTSNQYQGVVMTEAVPTKVASSVSPQEIRKVGRWVRQQMTEGMAGSKLDQLIQLRLTPQIAKAASKRIAKVREAHEGLSGHLYVDSGAYGTKNGTKGCDEGALRHRTNGLKFVLAQKQCSGCVFKNADGICQKYNKSVVDEISPATFGDYRTRVMASHEAKEDQETADLFNLPSMDNALSPVSEFGLHNATLDDIETEDPTSLGQLDGIFFGGFEV